ncbi:MAG TPA: ABC transporter ATP-binding protein [Ktedonobacterales bacterium]|nr:ABC transporter ATP-binding protein [Ktedonobacterales bacterium]
MVNTLLQLESITFGYTDQPLFAGVNLALAAGDMAALLGPNGTGKTTLLMLATGALHPQRGRVMLNGHDLRSLPRRTIARQIAVVPQTFATPFAFTVRELVGLGRTPYTSFLGTEKAADRQAIEEALEATGVAALAGRIFNELSGGEKQRVALALALAQQPKLLLLDEPTAHLDLKYQIGVLELAQHLNRERGITIFATMHDLNLAARYFPRLILFQRGIVADGPPVEALQGRLLRRVYEVPVEIGILHGAEHLSILPPTSSSREQHTVPEHEPKQPHPAIHVIGGGGSAAILMRGLADADIPFSIGALNLGDSDHALAQRLAAEVISEQPYAPIASETAERVRAALRQAQAQIICPTLIGPGNLVLLRLALEAAQEKLPAILLEPSSAAFPESTHLPENPSTLARIAARDYTNGEGLAIYTALLSAGAQIAKDVPAAIDLLRAAVNSSHVAR